MKQTKKTDKSLQDKDFLSMGLNVLFILVSTLLCKYFGYPLVIPLFLFFIGLHLTYCQKGGLRFFLNLGLLLTLIVCIAHFINQYTELSSYYIPVAGVTMLTMLLFNSRQVTFVIGFASSTIVTLVSHGGFDMMMTFFLGGMAGAYIVREARTRAQLMTAGIVTSLINIICLFLFHQYSVGMFSKEFLMHEFYPLALNGAICAFFVVATLKIFETLFGVLTNYSLLELSDFNQPLLKRMIMEAPGTYHHSLVVSNLAEAAADAIGAHALLTRVGAYYHDIGKMAHPEYFTENQLVGGNKHDNIEPSMSRLIILSHVKEGVELAKKHKLNPLIIDFIPQHHGTSLIFYFYQKSLEEAEKGEHISEENFRYPGPKPQTRETAITLLADSVEGATRALDEPNPQNIEETVKKVINNKFIDGQLDECPLTLKEIDKISSTFIRILSAMYHGRIKYPEKKQEKKNGNQNRNASEENSSKPQADKNNHPDNPDAPKS